MDRKTQEAKRAWEQDRSGTNALAYLTELERAGLLPGEPREVQLSLESKGTNMAVLTVEGQGHVLFSYGTPVALVHHGEWSWSSEAAYSRTSVSHVGKWMREHGHSRCPNEDIPEAELRQRIASMGLVVA